MRRPLRVEDRALGTRRSSGFSHLQHAKALPIGPRSVEVNGDALHSTAIREFWFVLVSTSRSLHDVGSRKRRQSGGGGGEDSWSKRK